MNFQEGRGRSNAESRGSARTPAHAFCRRAAEIFKIPIISLSLSKIGINRWYSLTPSLECFGGELKKKKKEGEGERRASEVTATKQWILMSPFISSSRKVNASLASRFMAEILLLTATVLVVRPHPSPFVIRIISTRVSHFENLMKAGGGGGAEGS